MLWQLPAQPEVITWIKSGCKRREVKRRKQKQGARGTEEKGSRKLRKEGRKRKQRRRMTAPAKKNKWEGARERNKIEEVHFLWPYVSLVCFHFLDAATTAEPVSMKEEEEWRKKSREEVRVCGAMLVILHFGQLKKNRSASHVLVQPTHHAHHHLAWNGKSECVTAAFLWLSKSEILALSAPQKHPRNVWRS